MSNRFGVLGLAALLFMAAPTAQEESAAEMNERTTVLITEFASPTDAWQNIDDVVMGGVSSSSMTVSDDVAVFEGKVSLENNGGFASVRSGTVARDLSQTDGITVRVRGDGKTYQFRIRTDDAWDGANYRMNFETKKGEWLDIVLPYTAFQAGYRGRELPNHPPIDPAAIRSVGLLIADKQEGPFRLEIDRVSANLVTGA